MGLIPIGQDLVWGWDCFDLDPSTGRRFAALFPLTRMVRELDRLRGQVNVDKDKFQVALDVRGYKPQELQVSLENNLLTVSGKHEERSVDERNFVSRQFTRSFTLLNSVDSQQINSYLAADGRTLRISAPFKRPAIQEIYKAPVDK